MCGELTCNLQCLTFFLSQFSFVATEKSEMETDNDLSFRVRVRLILIFEWGELALLHFCVGTVVLPAIVYSVLWECVLLSRNESIYVCFCVPVLHNAAPRRIAQDEEELVKEL